MKTKAIRQGDILIVPCDTVPISAVPVQPQDGRLIVALGEATGHHHSFHHRPGITMFRDDGAGGGLYIKTDAPIDLLHQEHSALTIGKGTHRVINQRTFSTGVVKRVVD